MPALPRIRSSRAFRLLGVGALLALASACDMTGTDPVPADIRGTWTGPVEERTVFVEITDSTVTVYDGLETTCFAITPMTIEARDGDELTLRTGDGASFTATVRAEDGELLVLGLQPLPGQATLTRSDRDLTALEECVITGQWEFTDPAFTEYVVVTDTSFVIQGSDNGSCYDYFHFELVDRGRDLYTLEGRDGSTFDVTIRNDAGSLVLIFSSGFSTRYDPSTADISDLDYCGAGDDSTVTCSALPALSLADSVSGELTTSSPRDAATGRYYDLYGLGLSEEQQVTIALTAADQSQLDTRLYVWTAGGAPWAGNDDAGQATLNSALTVTLPAGCWRIEATSFGPGETGAYTVRTD